MLALGVGNAWGAEATLSSISTKDVVTTKGQSVSTTFGDVTCKVTRNSGNQPGFYTSSGIVRYYSEDVMTLSVPSGNTITEVVFTMNSGNVGTVDVGTVSSDTWTGNAESISFTGTATVKITKIVVTYEATSGGQTPDPGNGGETTTVTYVFKDDPNCPVNATDWFSGTIDQYTGWTATKGGSNNPKYYTTGDGLRVYNGGNFTITSQKVMLSITLTFASGGYTFSASNTTTPQTVTPNAKSYEWSVERTCRLQKIEITYAADAGGGETPATELTDAQFAWSAATAEATMGASNTFPTLINTLPVTVTYESSKTAIATIDATSGAITLVAPGTTTISAKFAGGEVSGTTYAAKTVTYTLTVLKAPAVATGTVYVKVTDAVTDGEYLIVYEDAASTPSAPVIFDGSLATLDATGNMKSVSISGNVINGDTEIDAATFTISTMSGGFAIKSKSGKYIGRTSGSNGMNTNASSEILNNITISDGKITIAGSGDGSSTSLQYYATSGSERFRYYSSSQKAIALYKKVDPSEILAPAFSVAAGSFYDAQSVVITCATPGAKIYYTLDGTSPTSSSTEYTTAIAISETKTLKAIAIKGEYSSSVTEATYTILAPLATMQEIFDKATAVGSTATPVKVTMNNWVVTGVKGSNAYLTDGTKGLIIYTTSHGFVVGDVLSGTVACTVQLYNGSSELTELTKTTEGLTVTAGGTVTPVVVNDVTTLSGVNTGSVIKITGTCESGNVGAGVKLYGTLYTFDNLTVGNKYNVTGVYLQYGEVEEILPRKQEDIEEVQDLATATISVSNISLEVDETKTIEATITPDAAKTTVKYTITAGSENVTLNGATITGVKEGTATIRATIAEAAGKYYGTTKDFTVTVTPKSTKDNVVVLAKYGDQWYAMMAQYVSGRTSHLAALPVSYVGGKLYNVVDADKALIEWTRAVVDGKATFSNNSKYLTGKSDKTDLTLTATSCDWTISGESYLIGERTFFYNAENNWFRNFGTSNVGDKNYSGMPTVTAPVYETGEVPFEITTTAENGTAKGGGVYKAGDKVTLTADPAMDYTFVNWTIGGEVLSNANPYVFEATKNLDVVANFAEIPLPSTDLTGEFSVGQYEVAQFATGNLQYKKEGDEETWRFAKQQYQYIGDANINVGDKNYEGWIDMFGWSNGDANNFGVNPSNRNEDYTGEFQDWGTKMGEGWSTLSADQWKYLLNTRPNASSLKQIARVGSVVGIMLFPDNWNETPVVKAKNDSYFEVEIYNYDLDQWAQLENAGALFLPAAGRRTGGWGNKINYDQEEETDPEKLNGGHYKYQDNTNIYCYYWTSTINETTKNVSYLHNIQALGGDKYTIGTGAIWGEKGRYGQGVRLAKVTSTLIEIGDGDNSSYIAANEGKVMDVQVKRTFKSNDGYYTICLPFNIDASEIGKAYQVTSISDAGAEGFNMIFTEVTGELEAGQPYLILPKDLTNPIFENVTIVNTTGSSVQAQGAGITFEMIGAVNGGGQTEAGQYWVGEHGYFYNNNGNPRAKLGLRVYFNIKGMPAGMRARVVVGENAATDLENIFNSENTTIKVMENGRLFIIRDGVKYNAQGQRL